MGNSFRGNGRFGQKRTFGQTNMGRNGRYEPYKRFNNNQQPNITRQNIWEEHARTQNLKQSWAHHAKDTINLNKHHKPPEEDKW